MKLGIDSYTHPQQRAGRRRRARAGGRAWGWPACSSSFRRSSPFATTIWPRFAAAAEEKGLYIEFGMGSIFPWHPMAEKGRRLLAEAGCDAARLRRRDRHPAPARRPEARLADPALRGRQSVHARRRARHGGPGRPRGGHSPRGLPRRRRPGHEDRHGEPRRFHRPRAGLDFRPREQSGLRLHGRLRQPGLRSGRPAAAGRKSWPRTP